MNGKNRTGHVVPRVLLLAALASSFVAAQTREKPDLMKDARFKEHVDLVKKALPLVKQSPPSVWKGANGGSLQGTYLRHESLGKHVVFQQEVSKTGFDLREIIVPVEKVAAEHHEWLNARRLLDQGVIPPFIPAEASVPALPAAGLKPQPAKVNRNFPEIDYGKYSIDFDNLTDEVLVRTFLWWDAMGWLSVPKGRDSEDKAKWLSRKIRTRNDTSIGGVIKALEEYHDKEIKDFAGLQMYPKRNGNQGAATEDFSLEALKKYATGTNACYLIMDRYEGKKNEGFYYFFVSAVNGQRITVHKNGKNHELEMKNGVDAFNQPTTEFHFVNVAQAPAWLQKSRFVVVDDWLFLIACHVYAEVGKPVPIPDAIPPGNGATGINVQQPLPRNAREMKLTYEKRVMNGHLLAATETCFWFWEQGGSVQLYDAALLDEASTDRVWKWRLSKGQKMPDRSSWVVYLNYQQNSSDCSGRIVRHGDHLWIERIYHLARNFSDMQNGPNAIVIDLKSGAFLSTNRHMGPKSQLHGKFDLAKLRESVSDRCANSDMGAWLASTARPEDEKGIIHSRESFKEIKLMDLPLAMEILFFPPQSAGKSLWPAVSSDFSTLATHMIGSAEMGFLPEYRMKLTDRETTGSIYGFISESIIIDDFPRVKFTEGQAMEPGTWKYIP